MTALFDRLTHLFEQSAHVGLQGMRAGSEFAPPNPREAAVLMAVTDSARPGVLLTHRPETMASHPGQIAFPGGKLEPGEDAVAAALREAEEELNIARSAVRVIGTVDAFDTGSGFRITPVLGVIPPDLEIRPDPREVSAWFEAPLDFVLDRRNHVAKEGFFGPHRRAYHEIRWEEHRIWGITAGILRNLSHRVAWQELVR